MSTSTFANHIGLLDAYLKQIAPNFRTPWEAVSAIPQMHEEGNPTLQTEWQGWYAEHKLEKHGENIIPEFSVHSNIKNAEDRILDAFYEYDGMSFPMDIKTISGHKENIKGEIVYKPGRIMLNDEDTTRLAVKKYGATGVMIISGLAVMEDPENREVKELLAKLKLERDGVAISKYAEGNRKNGKKSRLLKKEFHPKRIEIHMWTAADFVAHETSELLVALDQPGMNSNGKPRPKKFNMSVAKLTPLISIDL